MTCTVTKHKNRACFFYIPLCHLFHMQEGPQKRSLFLSFWPKFPLNSVIPMITFCRDPASRANTIESRLPPTPTPFALPSHKPAEKPFGTLIQVAWYLPKGTLIISCIIIDSFHLLILDSNTQNSYVGWRMRDNVIWHQTAGQEPKSIFRGNIQG